MMTRTEEVVYRALAAADMHPSHTVAADDVYSHMVIVATSNSTVIRATYDPVATQTRAKVAKLNKSIAAGYILPQTSTW